jgi:hypothetical protein
MVKVGDSSNRTKDLKALEPEVHDAAIVVMDALDYEGGDGEE